ncbi:uncharacterized protein Tco025E_02426 [Trypanosoma conorhini]|uniref:Tetraspanin n=1 Tax=Trypanosoma conorhini TaxID=83891 RepID=A0A3S5IU59_9TRYP|nr:uncharacterized protein Tco025E_02426 [Trypanosoma conorhini]RNF24667.1 hypothetical protein Tco025E_02426 [Trypanosoma conorhini]
MSNLKLLGTATPERERMQPMDVYVPDEEDDWTSDAYNRLNGDVRPHRACYDCPGHRVLTACFSALLLLLSVAGSILVAVVGSQSERLGPCRNCGTLLLSLLVPGIFFLFVGLVGAISAWRETQFFSVLFSLLLAMAAFVLLWAGLLLAVLYLQVDASSSFLAIFWEHTVSSVPSGICDLQEWLQCSGFATSQCCVSNVTAAELHNVSPCYLVAKDGVTTLDPHTMQPVSWPSRACAPTCASSNVYNATCQEPLENVAGKVLPPTSGGLFALGFVLLGFAALAGYRASTKLRRSFYLRYEY